MSEKKDEKVLENLKVLFEIVFKKERSESYRDIFREVYGDDYPEEANPDSFVTITDLRTIAKNLNVGPGKTFIDLGCGRGGPGLWIARETGANYIGIDLSDNAIRQATQRLVNFKIEVKSKFQVGNINSLNFPKNSFDGALSIDAISFLPDPLAAIKETAKILRPKAFFVFTTWENKKSQKINDYRSYLRDTGFKIQSYSETPDWKQRQREVYQKTLELKNVLIKDMGRDGAFTYIMEAKKYLTILNDLRRILAVAMKI
ncbi:2-methoxy-6-polyprenyl-1,4-benzoquinol methylase, mitochondrial [subsurface metagenome]